MGPTNSRARMMNNVFSGLPNTIFDTMSNLAREFGAINLGQGFPDDPGPEDVRQKAADAIMSGWNQYPPMMGLPELREAISEHYSQHQNLAIDAHHETMVTSGATEALAAALLATINLGDEVVLFQPTYDAYLPLVLRAGGVPKFINLKPPYWTFEREDLELAFNERTKAVVFNNPLNPCGSVFSYEQHMLLAEFCKKYDVIAICDEVWEHLVFDGFKHITMMSIEGMRDRTIKIGSAGKIFSLTGWKVGFVLAAPHLLSIIAKAHQFLAFTTAPNLQSAVAFGLLKDRNYFSEMRTRYAASRDYFSAGLRECGFTVLHSQATYFVTVDVSGLTVPDTVFSNRLVREFGVAAIPVSAFYSTNPNVSNVRFCFAKTHETLDMGLDRLRTAARKMGL